MFLFTFLLIAIFVVLIELAQWITQKLSIPQVLGEIIMGLLIGPSLFNLFSFEEGHETLFQKIGIATTHEVEISIIVIEFIAEAAALFLLFEVGLEIDLGKMKKVGGEATSVAILGMLVSFVSGYLFFMMFKDFLSPHTLADWEVGLFVGGVLLATSIGISIRVMIELGRIDTYATRVLVGAAILDDILTLVVYSLLIGLIYSGETVGNGSPLFSIGKIVLSILAFFLIIIFIFKFIFPYFYKHAKQSTDKYFTLTLSLAAIFFFSWLAGSMYLATIIGAFVAGVLIGTDTKVQRNAEELIRPISRWFVPFFFLSVGLRINISTVSSWSVLWLGLLFAAVGILAKVIGSGIGSYFFSKRISEAIEVGLGMAPRGEVILLLSTELLLIGVFNDTLYTLVTMLVIISSLVVPMSMKWILKRKAEKGIESR